MHFEMEGLECSVSFAPKEYQLWDPDWGNTSTCVAMVHCSQKETGEFMQSACVYRGSWNVQIEEEMLYPVQHNPSTNILWVTYETDIRLAYSVCSLCKLLQLNTIV
jgi:hypothetical protein